MTKDEEYELRDSDAVTYRARMISKGIDLDKKIYMPYRLVNGVPKLGCDERRNDCLEDSGLCLLDFDLKDSENNRYDKVWKILKPHAEDWHIVHFERSLNGGCHATVRMIEGLTRKQMIRLFELRTGLKIDHCHDLARACFLVPNDYVFYCDDEYYHSKEPLAALPMIDEKWELDDYEKKCKEELWQDICAIHHIDEGAPNIDMQLNNAAASVDKQQQLKVVEEIADKISSYGVDITYSYERWYKLAFCLANEFGEQGRNLFHQFSCNHPNYNF